MSFPMPTVFYLVVYQQDVPGPQHRTLTSMSGLLRFVETALDDEERNVGLGPVDVFVVNTETLECARYDIGPLLKLAGKPRSKRKKPK